MLIPAYQDPIVSREYLLTPRPEAKCHAATIAEGSKGLVVAWFAGTHEGAPDVDIWLTRQSEGRWLPPRDVANGIQPDGTRYPCWNPVLFQPSNGPLMLFYKVGPNPAHWWGMLQTSKDGGGRWSKPKKLPRGFLGPIKNKPVQLENGDILCPSSTETRGWKVRFERTADLGKTWTRSTPSNDGKRVQAIQPSLIPLGGGRLLAMGRTRQNRIFRTLSTDDGLTWSPLALSNLPNNNSGTDALVLRDGRFLIVYNPTTVGKGQWTGPRTPLVVAVSSDASHWNQVATLEDTPYEEFSYPSAIQTRDGLVHVVYTWKRQAIGHAMLDPSRF